MPRCNTASGRDGKVFVDDPAVELNIRRWDLTENAEEFDTAGSKCAPFMQSETGFVGCSGSIDVVVETDTAMVTLMSETLRAGAKLKAELRETASATGPRWEFEQVTVNNVRRGCEPISGAITFTFDFKSDGPYAHETS